MKLGMLLKPLYRISVFISVAIGCLIWGVITMVQLYFFESVSAGTILSNEAFALAVTGIVFLICLLDICLISTYLQKKKKRRIVVLIRFVITYIIILAIELIGINIANIQQFSRLFGMIGLGIITIIIIIIVHITVSVVQEMTARTNLELENTLLKMKNTEATYQQLKQQVNPHFLFNSLSMLKTLMRKQPDKAETYLSKLSVFLRKSLENDTMSVITLDEELTFCLNYIDLQKVRFGEALQFSMDIPEEAKTGLVPVFSVQQLLENAIKHNALTQESPLFISLNMEGNRLIIRNNIQKKIISKSTGIGLTNLSERYKLLSGDDVSIKQENGCFFVSIKVVSHEDCNYRR